MAAAVSDRIAALSAGRGLVFGCDYNPSSGIAACGPRMCAS